MGPHWSVVVVALAVFAGATLQSALGFGFALVASPALLLVLSPPQALTVLLLLGPPVNLLIAVGERHRRWHVQTRLLWVLLLGAVPGIAVGALLLPLLGRRPLQVVVGLVVLVAVGQQARAPSTDEAARQAPTAATAAVGLATGVLTTSTGTNGPPMVLWISRLRLPAAQQRDTLFAAFSALGLVGLGALLLSGSFDPSGVSVGGLVLLVVLAVIGRAVGWVMFRRLAAERFRFVGLLLVAALGVVSLASGLAG